MFKRGQAVFTLITIERDDLKTLKTDRGNLSANYLICSNEWKLLISKKRIIIKFCSNDKQIGLI